MSAAKPACLVPESGRAMEPDGGDPITWAHRFWAERGLPGDEHPFVAMSAVLRFQRLMVERVESELRRHQLNLTDYMILMSLVLSETGARPVGRLANTMMLHKTTVTVAADRLEGRGLIVRRPHLTDRRTTLISITDAGRERGRQATESLRAIGFSFDGRGEDEARELVGLLTQLADARRS